MPIYLSESKEEVPQLDSVAEPTEQDNSGTGESVLSAGEYLVGVEGKVDCENDETSPPDALARL